MHLNRTRKRARVALLTVLAALTLTFSAPALAQERDCTGPTGDQYCPPTKTLKGSGDDPGDLPFTGLDLGLTVLAGAALLGAGIGVRRISRASE